MAYGCRVRDDKGKVILDIEDNITRFRWNSSLTASGGNQDLSDITGLKTAQFAYPTSVTDFNSVGHSVSRSGINIAWTTVSSPFNAATCVVYVFIYS